LQLCWAVGEYSGGDSTNADAARQLFESLELILYENLASRYEAFSFYSFGREVFSKVVVYEVYLTLCLKERSGTFRIKFNMKVCFCIRPGMISVDAG
jgi:hypothetical protein